MLACQYIKTGVNYGVGENIRAIKRQEKLVFHIYSKYDEPFGLLTMKSGTICTKVKWSSLKVNISIIACPHGFEKTDD